MPDDLQLAPGESDGGGEGRSRRRMGELLQGVFAVLLDQPEGMRAAEVIAEVERRVPPTGFENDVYSSDNTRRYPKIVRFSTIGAVKAGWLVKENGRWSLTPEGHEVYHRLSSPAELMAESDKLYRVWKRQQAPDGDDEVNVEAARGAEGSPLAVVLEEAEESAGNAIRDYLAVMPPYEFQNLVAELLTAMGYYVLWVAPPGPDQGVDLIAYTDALGTRPPRIKVQVKRQADKKIDAPELRAFMAVVGDQDVGIYVSAGGFTTGAQREARAQERRSLTLIDLDRLIRLWIEHWDKLEDAARLRLPLKPVYFLAPPD